MSSTNYKWITWRIIWFIFQDRKWKKNVFTLFFLGIWKRVLSILLSTFSKIGSIEMGQDIFLANFDKYFSISSTYLISPVY